MSQGGVRLVLPRRLGHREASPCRCPLSSSFLQPRGFFSQPLSSLSARLSPAAVHQELNALLGSSIIYWQNPAHSVRSEAPEPRPLGKPPIR